MLGTCTAEDQELNAAARNTAQRGATTDCNVCSIGKLGEERTRHQSSSEWHTMLWRLEHLQTEGCPSDGCPPATATWQQGSRTGSGFTEDHRASRQLNSACAHTNLSNPLLRLDRRHDCRRVTATSAAGASSNPVPQWQRAPRCGPLSAVAFNYHDSCPEAVAIEMQVCASTFHSLAVRR